jgi:vacuolar-type H+-ATPase subunit F/Vma7
MSRLIVVTRAELIPGFRLAGVEAYGADDVETAQELINSWMESDELNLLAIDDGLLEAMDPAFVKRLTSCERLPHLVIPGGKPLGPESSRQFQVAEMIRRAIGFHITFKGEEAE